MQLLLYSTIYKFTKSNKNNKNIFSKTETYSLWDIKALINKAYGPVPLQWQSEYNLPDFIESPLNNFFSINLKNANSHLRAETFADKRRLRRNFDIRGVVFVEASRLYMWYVVKPQQTYNEVDRISWSLGIYALWVLLTSPPAFRNYAVKK